MPSEEHTLAKETFTKRQKRKMCRQQNIVQRVGVCVRMEASHVQVCKPHIGVDALTQQELVRKKKKRKEKKN